MRVVPPIHPRPCEQSEGVLFGFAVCQSRRLMNAVVVIVRERWLSSCQQHTSRRGTCGSRPWRRRRPDDRRVTSPKTHPDMRTSSPNRNATRSNRSNPVCHKSSCSDGDPSIERWYQDVSPPAHLPGRGGMRWVPAPSACAVSDRAALAPSQRGDDGVPCCDWVDDVWVHAGAHLTVHPHDEVLP